MSSQRKVCLWTITKCQKWIDFMKLKNNDVSICIQSDIGKRYLKVIFANLAHLVWQLVCKVVLGELSSYLNILQVMKNSAGGIIYNCLLAVFEQKDTSLSVIYWWPKGFLQFCQWPYKNTIESVSLNIIMYQLRNKKWKQHCWSLVTDKH